jgi:nicotinamide-nucleotide amidase
MRAIVLSIGSELVSGIRLDTHSADISREVSALGIEVVRHETLDDDAVAIGLAFRRAAAEADLVIATGGLGPTLDDCTREGLAAAMGEPLEINDYALEHLEAWAKARGRTLSDSNRTQAFMPRGCRALPNPVGTACGIGGRIGRTEIFCMPGVPGEMALMLSDVVLPSLRAAVPGRVTRVRTVRTFGLPESILGEKLSDLMVPRRFPHVGTAVHGGLIDVHIYATGTPAEVDGLLAADVTVIRERLGTHVFAEGHEPLEEVVARLLLRRKATVAVAESCTGGLVAARLVNVSGISACLVEGVVAYSNESKIRSLGVPPELIEQNGAVSEEVVRAMAEGLRARTGADYAISDSGVAGPEGGTPAKPVGTVCMALADVAGTISSREIVTGDRQHIRERTVNFLLNMLRLRLEGL